jgi:hypothetical protein
VPLEQDVVEYLPRLKSIKSYLKEFLVPDATVEDLLDEYLFIRVFEL